MPRRGESQHVHTTSNAALVMIDVIHDFAVEDGSALHAETLRILGRLRWLRRQARLRGIPVIYVNDNFGRWRSSFDDIVARATRGGWGDVARRLKPAKDDLAVLKPGRSAFYHSPFELLLEQMETEVLILCGITTDQCVLATANDAITRKLRVHVPSDTCASMTRARHDRAIALMRDAFEVCVTPSDALDLAAFVRRSPGSKPRSATDDAGG